MLAMFGVIVGIVLFGFFFRIGWELFGAIMINLAIKLQERELKEKNNVANNGRR